MCVRPDLTMSSNSVALRSSDSASRGERGKEVLGELVEGSEMDCRGEDVVRGLAHVDVVVRVHAIACKRREHFVRVRVRARTGARLEDVDRELVVELAGRHAIAGGCDSLGDVGVEQPELAVHPARQRP